MVRTEISLFMKNVPGELGKLASLLGDEGVNIDALTIQDASSYVQNLFQARSRQPNFSPETFQLPDIPNSTLSIEISEGAFRQPAKSTM